MDDSGLFGSVKQNTLILLEFSAQHKSKNSMNDSELFERGTLDYNDSEETVLMYESELNE